MKPSGFSAAGRRRFVRGPFLAGTLVLLACGGGPDDVARIDYACTDCNVVVIVIDCLRPDHLGFAGHSRDTSPRIDALARRSVVFDAAYSPSSWTRSAMAAVLTSKLPIEIGILSERRNHYLHAEHWTLQEFFNEQGYATAAFLTNPHYVFGLDQQFDHEHVVMGEPAEALYSAAAAWIGERGEERFFALLHHNDPHAPYVPHPGFGFTDGIAEVPCADIRDLDCLDGYELAQLEAAYDGEIAYVDAQLGSFLDGLEQSGLGERTIVVVTADHGEEFLDHGGYYHGHSLYEELLRVPLLLRLPGVEPARIGARVGTIDLFPTLASVVAPSRDEAPRFSGQSLMPLIEGKPWVEKPIFAASGFRGQVKYALIDGRHKIITRADGTVVGLFDLQVDPAERTNLASSRGLQTYRMKRRLEKIVDERSAPRPPEVDVEVSDEILARLRSLGYVD